MDSPFSFARFHASLQWLSRKLYFAQRFHERLLLPSPPTMLALYVQGSYAISYHGHPGYYCGYDHETNEDIGRGYAEKINSLALLFADEGVTGPLKELGFVENSHYLPVS